LTKQTVEFQTFCIKHLVLCGRRTICQYIYPAQISRLVMGCLYVPKYERNGLFTKIQFGLNMFFYQIVTDQDVGIPHILHDVLDLLVFVVVVFNNLISGFRIFSVAGALRDVIIVVIFVIRFRTFRPDSCGRSRQIGYF